MRNKMISLAIILSFLTAMLHPSPTIVGAAASDLPAVVASTWNVALGAEVSATGQCNASENAGNAVDGKNDTKWCDNTSAQNKWLKLDLGKVYNINQWVVQNAAIGEKSNSPYWNTKDFRLQKSMDGETWEDVDVVENNVQTIVSRYVPTFSAQYVRLYIDAAATSGNVARIYEFEVYGVNSDQIPAYPEINHEPVDYVDPFINTLGDNGQTNPGPKMPFGLVALGPDSDGGGFSGYYYEDKNLKGFSHLRMSGVGCSGGGGNILMMPSNGSFTNNSSAYKQKYDKHSEKASPGYYGVTLASGIEVELTASDNVGFHRYTFPESGPSGSVLIDLSNSYGGMIDAGLKVENKREISGMVKSKNVCGNGYYIMYYSIQFDHDFDSYTSWSGDSNGPVAERTGSKSGVWVNFNTADDKVIQAKVGLSTISVEQAKFERDHDIADWNFDAQQARTREAWSQLLNKVQVTDSDEENKTIFYTKLYHAFLHPNNVTSSSGTFRAARDEDKIRHVSEIGEDFEYYNGWATWDDFRKYSLYSLLEPKKFENMVKSMIDIYKTRGSYVQWGDGYWPSPTVRNEFNGAVILDAIAKGFNIDRDDVYTALQGMATDADNYSIKDSEISGKLEKAYSAYFPMKLAAMVGDRYTYEKYKDIAISYQEMWNPNQVDESGKPRGFFTPNAVTVNKGDITQVNKYAYQGNLWTYRWFVPHDVAGLAELIGSKRDMAIDLQYFFKIDEYVAVNQPDIHVPFLFNYLSMPYLTQYYAREFTTEVVTQKYHNHGPYAYPVQSRVYRADPEGYLASMDDDAGSMSSWFVFSALGLFPGNPGESHYLIGSPIFSEVKLNLDNGKTFTIKANNVSSVNRFIQSAQLNGKTFDQAWISYEDIMAGGTLEFEMGSEPNYQWGAKASAAPPSTDFSATVDNLLAREELIAKESEWKYFDKGKYAGDGWTELKYDDSGWASGKAMLGYDKFGNVNTEVSYGPDSGNRYPTTYFRKTFEVAEASDIFRLEANLIRDDGAIVYLNGREIIRTNMAAGEVGYNTYANGTVGDERNWLSYRIDPSYLVEGTNIIAAEVHQVNASSSDLAFDFTLHADKEMEIPDAPSGPVVDNAAKTFGWTIVPGFEEASDYEYSTDGGKSWADVVSNPQPVGSASYKSGLVQVRVKANESLYQAAGRALVSNAAYTEHGHLDLYDLEVKVNREGNMVVDVDGKLKGDYDEAGFVVFQLMDGNEQAYMTNAVPVGKGSFQLSQLFNVNASKFQVNVYLVDDFNGNVYDSEWLAKPIEPQPEPAPEITDEEEQYPDPLPLPGQDTEEPGEGEEPEEGKLKIEFESFSEWTNAVNTFNNGGLKTEGNNGGTVVANTFDKAWLAYRNVDFGDEGKNYIAVEYDAPSTKAPVDALLEIRLGGIEGELVGTVSLPNTGDGWGTYEMAEADLLKTVTGVQDIFVIMKGSTTKDRPYIGNFDRLAFTYKKIRRDFANLELETYDEWSADLNPSNNGPLKTEAGKSGEQVANTFAGAWLAYQRMDFGKDGVNQLSIEYVGNSQNCAADAAVEVRLGGVNGTLVGTIATPPTGSGWGTYKVATGSLSQTITGIQDVYLVFTGTTSSTYKYIGNFDNVSFSLELDPPDPGSPGEPGEGGEPEEGKLTVEFENRSEWTSAANAFNGNGLKTEGNNGGTVVANTFTGAWLAYRNVDFGAEGKNHISVEYDAPSEKAPGDALLEIRLGGIEGDLIGTVRLPQTGSKWGTYNKAEADLMTTLRGTQDIYVVMKGSTTNAQPYIGNLDRMEFTYQKVRQDFANLELETYDGWSADLNPFNNGPLKTETGQSGKQVANTFAGAWLAYKRMDFGKDGVNQLSILYTSNSQNCAADSAVEVRLGGVDGTLVGTIAAPPTGSGWGTYKEATGSLTRTVTGIQDVYLVFTGTMSSTYKYIGNFDHAGFSLNAD